MSEWQPIDTAPKDGTEIILGWWGGYAGDPGLWHDGSENYWNEAGWYFSSDQLLTSHPCKPECWLPFPRTPLDPPL